MNIEQLDPATLVPADYNPRKISKHQSEALKRSLDRWGFVEPIVANKRTGRIVGGHQRLDGALALALPTVPVHWIDVDEASEKALNIALNQISGEWDEQLLSDLLLELEHDGQDLEDLGFDADELQAIIDAAAPAPELNGDLDEVPEPPAVPITQPGDLWLLGKHRLLCGDSTSADDVAKLMDGTKIDAVVTDPPYGINLDTDYSGMGTTTSTYAPVVGDDKPFDFSSVMSLVKSPLWYVWGGDYLAQSIPCWSEGSTLVWAKAHSEDENLVFGSSFELCWRFPKGKKEIWFIRRIQMTSERTGQHPTQKPVECMARPLRNHSEANIVYDPFSGSGTTIIAAEKLGRSCFAMEISPAYCDVAVQRYEKATGNKAERIPR